MTQIARSFVGGRNGWYLIAYDRLRHQEGGFRLDRIDHCQPLDRDAPAQPLQELLGDYPQAVEMRLVSHLLDEE